MDSQPQLDNEESSELIGQALPEAFSNINVLDDAVTKTTDTPILDAMHFDGTSSIAEQSKHEENEEETPTAISRTLPDGKTFHLFFVYRTVSPDKDWVSSTVDKLESTYPGFKCGYHMRDFIPGQSIVGNISSCLRQSLKVAFVLTPQFLQSDWTKYETDLAKCLSLNADDASGLSLIPILLEECEIPDCLKDTTYLNVQGDAQCWLPKLATVVMEKANQCSSHVPPLALRSRFAGGTKCWLLDVAFDAQHNIIVTDGKNRAVKKFSMEGEILGEITFEARPDCLTQYAPFEFIVTFPKQSCLRILNTEHEIKTVRTIPVPTMCFGIAKADGGDFAVVCRTANAILLCSIDAGIKNRIPLADSTRLGHSYLALSPEGVMFVTEHNTEELMIIHPKQSDDKGLVRRKSFSDLRGMCCIGEHLLISAGSVRLCTLNGDPIRDMSLPGVYHARALAYNPAKRLVALTHKSDSGEQISIYGLGTTVT